MACFAVLHYFLGVSEYQPACKDSWRLELGWHGFIADPRRLREKPCVFLVCMSASAGFAWDLSLILQCFKGICERLLLALHLLCSIVNGANRAFGSEAFA